MKRWHKALILSLMGGDLYCMVELIWRGHTHWSMFLLAAMLSLPLDLANEHMAWERPLWLQALIGGSVITLAELGAGLILNVWLKLDNCFFKEARFSLERATDPSDFSASRAERVPV